MKDLLALVLLALAAPAQAQEHESHNAVVHIEFVSVPTVDVSKLCLMGQVYGSPFKAIVVGIRPCLKPIAGPMITWEVTKAVLDGGQIISEQVTACFGRRALLATYKACITQRLEAAGYTVMLSDPESP